MAGERAGGGRLPRGPQRRQQPLEQIMGICLLLKAWAVVFCTALVPKYDRVHHEALKGWSSEDRDRTLICFSNGQPWAAPSPPSLPPHLWVLPGNWHWLAFPPITLLITGSHHSTVAPFFFSSELSVKPTLSFSSHLFLIFFFIVWVYAPLSELICLWKWIGLAPAHPTARLLWDPVTRVGATSLASMSNSHGKLWKWLYVMQKKLLTLPNTLIPMEHSSVFRLMFQCYSCEFF